MATGDERSGKNRAEQLQKIRVVKAVLMTLPDYDWTSTMSRLKITSVRQGLGFTQRGSVYVLPSMPIACDISSFTRQKLARPEQDRPNGEVPPRVMIQASKQLCETES